MDNFKRQFAHLEAGGRGQANPNLGQATSLPRERVSEFRSEAARYLAAQRGPMSGVAAAAAYSTQPGLPGHGVGPGGPPPSTAYPYGSSVDMEGAVELVGGRVVGRAGADGSAVTHLLFCLATCLVGFARVVVLGRWTPAGLGLLQRDPL